MRISIMIMLDYFKLSLRIFKYIIYMQSLNLNLKEELYQFKMKMRILNYKFI